MGVGHNPSGFADVGPGSGGGFSVTGPDPGYGPAGSGGCPQRASVHAAYGSGCFPGNAIPNGGGYDGGPGASYNAGGGSQHASATFNSGFPGVNPGYVSEPGYTVGSTASVRASMNMGGPYLPLQQAQLQNYRPPYQPQSQSYQSQPYQSLPYQPQLQPYHQPQSQSYRPPTAAPPPEPEFVASGGSHPFLLKTFH